MRTYNPDATCPKCGSADIATRYARPPAAPAQIHTCVHSEVVEWRDGWRIYRFHDNCLTCGRSLACEWLNPGVLRTLLRRVRAAG